MERYLKIGERYVQWVALGLGGLYLLLMVVWYVFSNPLTVTVGGKACTPGQVNPVIDDGEIKKIQEGLRHPIRPDFPPSKASEELAANLMPGLPPIVYHKVEYREVLNPTPIANGPKSSLPLLPAATVAAGNPSNGTSVIADPVGAVHVGAAVATPADPAAAAAAAAAAPQKTVDWLSYNWNVNLDQMAKSFNDAHILPILMTQQYVLKVELQREELLPDGKWSAPVTMPAMGTEVPPAMPSENADIDTKNAFKEDAASHQGLIRQPTFPTVVAGAVWYPPGTPPITPDAFAPVPVVVPGAAPGAPVAAPEAPARPIAPQPAIRPRGAYPASGTPDASATGEEINLAPPDATPPVDGQPVPALPAPSFGTLTLLTHDWTVVQGRTYRFRVRYFMKNPMFGQTVPQIPKEFTGVLSLASPYSEWSAPASIPTHFRVYVRDYKPRTVAGQPGPDVTFDIFAKKPDDKAAGIVRNALTCSPGDPIGESGWTYIDVRKDSAKKLAEPKNQYYFLLADPTGHVQRRDVERDQNDVEYRTFLDRTGGTTASSVP